jgi:hypothetical protein
MNVTVTVDLPPDVEERLRAQRPDLAAAVREAFALDLYRRGVLDRHGLSQALGLDRFETFALLKRHQIFEGTLTHEDVDADVKRINELLGPPRP